MFSQIADSIVYDIFSFEHTSKLAKALHFFLDDTIKILFLAFIIIYAIGLLRSYIAQYKIEKYLLHTSKLVNYILAALMGAITPFCCCSSIPLFIGLLASGISLDIAMAFFITSPLVNEIAVALLIGAIGVKYTVVYIAASIFVGVCGGYASNTFKISKWISREALSSRAHDHMEEAETDNFMDRSKAAYNNATNILKKILPFVVIGVGLGSILHSYMTQEWFVKYGNLQNYFAVPIAVLIGLPLYANIASLVPTVEVLFNNHIPIGTIIAFMMSVVAISIPQLIILYRVLKWRILIFFVAFLVVMFILVGYFLNFIFVG